MTKNIIDRLVESVPLNLSVRLVFSDQVFHNYLDSCTQGDAFKEPLESFTDSSYVISLCTTCSWVDVELRDHEHGLVQKGLEVEDHLDIINAWLSSDDCTFSQAYAAAQKSDQLVNLTPGFVPLSDQVTAHFSHLLEHGLWESVRVQKMDDLLQTLQHAFSRSIPDNFRHLRDLINDAIPALERDLAIPGTSLLHARWPPTDSLDRRIFAAVGSCKNVYQLPSWYAKTLTFTASSDITHNDLVSVTDLSAEEVSETIAVFNPDSAFNTLALARDAALAL